MSMDRFTRMQLDRWLTTSPDEDELEFDAPPDAYDRQKNGSDHDNDLHEPEEPELEEMPSIEERHQLQDLAADLQEDPTPMYSDKGPL
jgi:hypothetical protein